MIPAVAAPRPGGFPLSKTRILVIALLLVPVVALAAPPASAMACNPDVTGISEIDSVEYGACTTVLGDVNRLCHNCLA